MPVVASLNKVMSQCKKVAITHLHLGSVHLVFGPISHWVWALNCQLYGKCCCCISPEIMKLIKRDTYTHTISEHANSIWLIRNTTKLPTHSPHQGPPLKFNMLVKHIRNEEQEILPAGINLSNISQRGEKLAKRQNDN